MSELGNELAASVLEMAGEATLTVPLDYVQWMRYAALKELKEAATSVATETETTRKGLFAEDFNRRHGTGEQKEFDWLVSDLNGTCRNLRETLQVATDFLEKETPSLIFGRPGALAYLLDAFSRHVLTRELENTDGPLDDEEDANHLAPIIEALQWAGIEIVRLRALDAAERREARETATERKAS